MRPFAYLTTGLAIVAAAPAFAADYNTTVAATAPTANFRLTTPNAPSTVGGYTTGWSATTTAGPGAPIAADPANTGARFAPADANALGITTSLTGGIPGRGSINLWINLSALPSTLGRTFALAGESQSGNDFDFQIESDNMLRFYTGSGENTAFALDPTTLVGQWHMLTASYDGTLGNGGFRNIYLDGNRVGSFTGTVNGAAKSGAFTIGYNNTFGGRAFAGSIDEVTVWNYGLDDSQVAGIYRSRLESASPAGVPEPATWAMMLLGFGGMGHAMRRRAANRTRIHFA